MPLNSHLPIFSTTFSCQPRAFIAQPQPYIILTTIIKTCTLTQKSFGGFSLRLHEQIQASWTAVLIRKTIIVSLRPPLASVLHPASTNPAHGTTCEHPDISGKTKSWPWFHFERKFPSLTAFTKFFITLTIPFLWSRPVLGCCNNLQSYISNNLSGHLLELCLY